jgi:hypothetical protein
MAKVEQQVQRNMDKAAIYLQGEVVRSFGSPTALPAGGVRNARGRSISAKKWRSMQHSAPGDPPFIQLGNLKRSITWAAPSRLIRYVGSALQPQGGSPSYALCLEYGTSKMAARPFLRPALAKCRRAIFRIIALGK